MKRCHSQVAVAVVLLLLLTACGRIPQRRVPVPTGATASHQDVRSIKVLTYPGDSALDGLIAGFYAEYPDYRIEKVSVPVASSAADVAYRLSDGQVDLLPTALPGVNLPELARAGQLAALDPYIKTSRFDLRPFGGALETLRLDGDLYDLPYAVQPLVVLYNQDLFQAAGVPLPRDGWTWDQFRDAARTLTRGDGEGKVWGAGSNTPDALVRIWLAQQMAGSAAAAPDEQTLREALQFFTTLTLTDRAMPPVKAGGIATYNRISFEQGEAAMSVESLSRLPTVSRNARFKWNVAPMPVAPGGTDAQPVTPLTYAIAARGPNPDGAWVFLRFAAGPKGAAAMIRAGLFPLYSTADVKRAWFDQQPPPPAGTESLFTARWQIEPRTADAGARRYRDALGALLTQALSGQRPWEEALHDYLREAEQIQAETR